MNKLFKGLAIGLSLIGGLQAMEKEGEKQAQEIPLYRDQVPFDNYNVTQAMCINQYIQEDHPANHFNISHMGSGGGGFPPHKSSLLDLCLFSKELYSKPIDFKICEIYKPIYVPIFVNKSKNEVLSNCLPLIFDDILKIIFENLTKKDKSNVGKSCLRFAVFCGKAMYSPYINCFKEFHPREMCQLDNFLYDVQNDMQAHLVQLPQNLQIHNFHPLNFYLIQGPDMQLEQDFAETQIEEVVLPTQDEGVNEDVKDEKDSTQG